MFSKPEKRQGDILDKSQDMSTHTLSHGGNLEALGTEVYVTLSLGMDIKSTRF